MTKVKKEKYYEIAYTSIILYLSDTILWKIEKFDSTNELWKKLDDLYLFKSIPNKLYILEIFFNFKIDHSNDFDYNLNVFNKLI